MHIHITHLTHSAIENALIPDWVNHAQPYTFRACCRTMHTMHQSGIVSLHTDGRAIGIVYDNGANVTSALSFCPFCGTPVEFS